MLLVNAGELSREKIEREKGKLLQFETTYGKIAYGKCRIQYAHYSDYSSDLYIQLGVLTCTRGLYKKKDPSGKEKMHLRVKLGEREPSTKGILHAFKAMRTTGAEHMSTVEIKRGVLPLKKYVWEDPDKNYENEIWYPRDHLTGALLTDEIPILHLPVTENTKFLDLKGESIDRDLLVGNYKIVLNPIIKVTHTYVGPSSTVRDKFFIDSATIVKVIEMDTASLQKEFVKKYVDENPFASDELDKMLEGMKLKRRDEEKRKKDEIQSEEKKEPETYSRIREQIDPRFTSNFLQFSGQSPYSLPLPIPTSTSTNLTTAMRHPPPAPSLISTLDTPPPSYPPELSLSSIIASLSAKGGH